MQVIGFDRLYLEDFNVYQLFASDQRWQDGYTFTMQRKRKTSALVYLKDCRAVYKTPEGIREYGSGSILYIPQNSVYKTTFLADTQSRGFTQLIEFELRDRDDEIFICSDRIVQVATDEGCYYGELFAQLTAIYQSFAYSYGEFKSVLYDLLSRIAKGHQTQRLYSKEFYAIAPAIDYLTKASCIHETVADLARLCNISESSFRTLFKKYAGSTPSEYCLKQKMKRARKLLQSNLYTVTQVAQLLGYTDPGYFSKVFKNENGVSPKDFGAREE